LGRVCVHRSISQKSSESFYLDLHSIETVFNEHSVGEVLRGGLYGVVRCYSKHGPVI